MCTLSFVPLHDGYAVGMNRDEQRCRPRADVPTYFERNGIGAVYPPESSGGTWIAVNHCGLLFALLNWHPSGSHLVGPKERSRGELIPQMIFDSDFRSAQSVLAPDRLKGMLPFRLIAVEPEEKAILEWRWDGRRIGDSRFPWARKHWFSSSLFDAQAEEHRHSTCMAAASGRDPEGRDWLAELHRSHRPFSGPYSICVHRPDAATVSYTELVLNSRLISTRYVDGSPCETAGFHHVVDLPRPVSQSPRRAPLSCHASAYRPWSSAAR